MSEGQDRLSVSRHESIVHTAMRDFNRRVEHQLLHGDAQAIVLHSGGLDSTTALALACRRWGREHVVTVSVAYGQRHAVELDVAENLAKWFNVREHLVVNLPLPPGDSVLMESNYHRGAEMPHESYEALQEHQGPSPTYVPFRNGFMLSAATAIALDRKAKEIYCGMHAEDAANWAYPDCTPEFIGAMQNAIYIGSYMKVRLVAPFTYKTKAEIIQLGIDLGVPFKDTHSCYEGKRPACGKCPTCVARLEAFKKVEVNDPLEYQFDEYRRFD